MELNGRVALITGAASGIGRATALRLAEAGARLYLCDIDDAGLAAVIAQIDAIADAGPGRATGETLNVADPEACTAAICNAVQRYGRLDILCNIAGVLKTGHLADVSVADWRRLIDVNLGGVFYLCQAAIPHLQQSQGCIVNMASSAGLTGQAYTAAYGASKAGVIAFSKALAMEFASSGVRVNALCPGAIKTPMARQFQFPDGADQSLFSRCIAPLGHAGTPEQVAEAVLFLASPAADYITGIALPVDGGQVAG
jgi:meso-butanediol dehydrogenase/(S,S)-butanediol dehydrogenase/diacetyl reductase